MQQNSSGSRGVFLGEREGGGGQNLNIGWLGNIRGSSYISRGYKPSDNCALILLQYNNINS